ncbi:MAG: UPF0149 family protein [bacterium]
MQPDFSTLEVALSRAGGVHQPSEVHGILTGMLIFQSSVPEQGFVRVVLGQGDPGDVLHEEASEVLAQLHRSTLKQLQDPELGFELLLPDEDEPLDARLEAACSWAAGVIYGLAQQGVNVFKGYSEDTAAFLEDCRDIAKGGFELSGEPGDEDIFEEVVDYLRMGTLMVQEEMQPIKAPPQIH